MGARWRSPGFEERMRQRAAALVGFGVEAVAADHAGRMVRFRGCLDAVGPDRIVVRLPDGTTRTIKCKRLRKLAEVRT